MGAIILGFGILAAIIIFIYLTLRYDDKHPYRPRTQNLGRPRDFTNDPYYCKIHQSYFAHMGATCPSCEHDYSNDVIAGVYPPGIDESNKNFYFVEDWIALRKIDLERDRRIKEDKISPATAEEEAIKKRDDYIMKTISKRIAVAKETDPEIQRAKLRENARRQHYAGAAQYSGIDFK